MDNTFTTEIVRGLFGPNIAPIILTCKCSYQRASGRMYIASNAMCFYSNIFGFERKLIIRTVDITFAGLTRNTSIIIRSKCTGTTSSANTGEKKDDENVNHTVNDDIIFEEEHVFRSFNDRESVLKLILDVIEKRNQKYGSGVFVDEDEDEDEDDDNDNHNHRMFLTNNMKGQQQQQKGMKKKVTETNDGINMSNTPVRTIINRIDRNLHPYQAHSDRHFDNESVTSLRVRTYSDPDPVTPKYHDLNTFQNATFIPNRRRGDSTPDWIKNKDFNTTTTTMPLAEEEEEAAVVSVGIGRNHIAPVPSDLTIAEDPNDTLTQKVPEENVSRVSSIKPTTKRSAPITTTIIKQRKEPTLEEIKTNFEKDYPKLVVNSHHIPNCSINEFYKKYLADNASHSLQVFQDQIIQDQDIVFSNWEPVVIEHSYIQEDQQQQQQNGEKLNHLYQKQKRSISFLHPRNAKLGPSTALTKKQQVCTIYPSSSGITVNTETKLDGVPYSDCFIVEEEWIIEPSNNAVTTNSSNEIDDMNEGRDRRGVEISIRFHLNFVKPTMMKKIIDNQTKQEVKDWYKLYLQYLSSSVETEAEIENTSIANIVIDEFESQGHDDKKSFLVGILSSPTHIMLVTLLAYLLYQIHSLNMKVMMMEDMIHVLQSENVFILNQFGSMKEIEETNPLS